MSLTQKIAHNTVYQMIGKVVSTTIGVIVAIILIRYLGDNGYGQYGIIVFYLSFFSILADMGLYIILTKKISEPNANEELLVGNVFTMRTITAVVLLGIAPIIAMFFPYDPIVKMGIALTSLSFLFHALNQVLWGIFQKHLKIYKVAIAENVGRVLMLVGTLLVVYYHGNLLWIMSTVVVGSFVNFLVTFLWTRSHVKIRFRFDWPLWKQILKESWPIALSITFNLVYFRLDGLVLAHYHSTSDVGIYAAPYKILEVVVTVPAIFAGLAMPVLTDAFARADLPRFRNVLQKSIEALLMLALPLVVGTWFVADDLMRVITRERWTEFLPSGPVLRILIIATGIIFLGNLFANAVVAINKQKSIILGYAFVALVSVVGYFVFIPPYSYIGAAWVTVLAEGLMMLIGAGMVFISTRTVPNLNIPLRIALSTIVMGVVLWIAGDVHFIWKIVMAIAVYGVLVVATGALSRDRIREIIQLRKP